MKLCTFLRLTSLQNTPTAAAKETWQALEQRLKTYLLN